MKAFILAIFLCVFEVFILDVYTDKSHLDEEEVKSYEQLAYEWLATQFPEKYGPCVGNELSDKTPVDVVILEIHPTGDNKAN